MTNLERFKKVKACIFDLDGTLMDSMDVWANVDRQFFLSRGMQVPDDYQKAIAHMSFKDIARYTIDRFHLQESVDDLIGLWMGIAKSEYAFHVKAKRNAVAFVKKLKEKGFSIALATSNQPALYIPCLTHNGLFEYFDILRNVDAVNGSKKEPTLYLSLCADMGTKPEETAVFEDILTAIRTAHDSQFVTVAVKDRTSERDYPEIERLADLVIDDFQQAINVFESQNILFQE